MKIGLFCREKAGYFVDILCKIASMLHWNGGHVAKENFALDVIVENISDDYYEQILETKKEFSEIDLDLSFNYNSDIEKHGWKTPGQEKPHSWCGEWNAIGCNDHKTHEVLGYGKKTYAQQYRRSCFRASCKTCLLRWATRQSLAAAQRTQIYEKHRGGKLKHLKISLPVNYDYSNIKKVRGDAIKILKEKGVQGGAMIFIPFQLNAKTRVWDELPCFFVAYYGETIESCFVNGWDVSKIFTTKSNESVFFTALRMSGVKKGQHSFVWFGSLSYSKLKLKKPTKKAATCPACNAKLFDLVRLRYNYPNTTSKTGFDPDDAWKTGFFEPNEWKLANPENRLLHSLMSKFRISRKMVANAILAK